MQHVIFEARLVDGDTVDFPFESQILKVDMQGEHPTAWYLCPVGAPTFPALISRVGTGPHFSLEERSTYLGTVQDGPYVWHFFGIDKSTDEDRLNYMQWKTRNDS